MLLLVFILFILTNANKANNHNDVIIAGFSDTLKFVLQNKDCIYPDNCYDIMAEFISNPNVTFVGLMPYPDTPECNITDNPDNDDYIVFGVDSDFKYVNNSIYVSNSLWNTLGLMCSVTSIPETRWAMITHSEIARNHKY